MPVSCRSGVSVRSSRVDSEAELPAVVSRVVRTSIRPGRKSSKSQRFVRELDPPSNSSHVSTDDTVNFRQPHDDERNQSDYEYVVADGVESADEGVDGDSASDVSDVDVLPSFGPQLSLEEEPTNADILNFSQMDFGDFEKNVSIYLYSKFVRNGLIHCRSTL